MTTASPADEAELDSWPIHLREVARSEGWLAADEAVLLHDLARDVRDGCVVEVGSYRGRSTVALALGVSAGAGVPVYAVEPHEEFVGALGGVFGPADRGAFYRTMLRSGAYRHVRLVNLSSEVVTAGWQRPVGLLWVDGDHRYPAVRRDFDCWAGHLRPDAVVALDDAVDEGLGPRRLADELVDAGWQRRASVGKVVVLGR